LPVVAMPIPMTLPLHKLPDLGLHLAGLDAYFGEYCHRLF